MMKRILMLVLCWMVWPPGAWATNCGGSTVCACGDTLTSSYTLAADLACTNAGVILTVGANDLTLDLDGHTIAGDDVHTVSGIRVNNITGFTIQNGVISDVTSEGLLISGTSTGIVVNDLVCNSTGNQGFQMLDTASATFNRITGNNNVDDGFSMHDDAVATIHGGTFNNNDQGINTIHDTVLVADNISTLGNTTYAVWAIDSGLTATLGPQVTIAGLEANSPILADANSIMGITRAKIHDVAGAHSIDTMSGSGQGDLDLSYSAISNIAAGKYGVAIRAGSVSKVSNCDFITAGAVGGGVYSAATSLVVANSIFTGLPTGILEGGTGTVTSTNNIFYTNTANTTNTVNQTGSILANPLLNADLSFAYNSPAINAGTIIAGTHDQTTHATDIAGTSVLTIPDIGAYEYPGGLYFNASAADGGNGTKSLPYNAWTDYTWTGYSLRAGAEIYLQGAMTGTLDLSGLTDTGAKTVQVWPGKSGSINGFIGGVNDVIDLSGTSSTSRGVFSSPWD